MSRGIEEQTFETGLAVDEPVSQAVTRGVASATGRPVRELPPLHRVIDTEALDTLSASIDRISFSYGGYEVTVTSDERIHLRSTTDS